MKKLFLIVFTAFFVVLSFLNIPVVSASSSHHRKAHTHWKKVTAPVSFPILMYHSITNIPGNSLCLPPEQFEHQMELLHKEGYYTLTPSEAYRVLTRQEVPVGKENKIVFITFDDGYKNNYSSAYPILKKFSLHATIGMITDKINTPDMLSTNELKKLRKEKLVSIVSHTVSHTELNTLNTEQQLVEMANSRGLLNRSLKQNTILLIYPVGRYTPASPFIAQRAGYKFALTTKHGLANASQGLYELHRQRVIPNMSDESFNQLLSGN